MPSNYTHYKFGLKVLENLDVEIKIRILKNYNLFLIGLHGPDILYYHITLKRNGVNKIGFSMHDQVAYTFFDLARRKIRKSNDIDASMAYILGYICHFSLDSECHGYIEAEMKQSGRTHSEIETSFERILLLQDGINPQKYNTASHLKVRTSDAKIISQFYDSVDTKQVEKALKSMIKYNQFLMASNPIKEYFVRLLLFLSGHYKELQGLIIKKEESKYSSNQELEQRYQHAVKVATELIHDFNEKCNTSNEFDSRFLRTYGADEIKNHEMIEPIYEILNDKREKYADVKGDLERKRYVHATVIKNI